MSRSNRPIIPAVAFSISTNGTIVFSISASGIILTILALTLSFLLQDGQQNPNSLLLGSISVTSVVWGCAFLLFFLMWTLYYAYFVLPNNSVVAWNNGHRLLWRYYVHQPANYIIGLLLKLRLNKSVKEKEGMGSQKPAYEYSFDQIGAGVVPTHIVLALDKISSKTSRTTPRYKTLYGKPIAFSRAAGPGIVILRGNFRRKTEKIMRKIDIRPHIRTEPVTAVTRDGINIRTSVIVIFHVNRANTGNNTSSDQENDEKHYALYPYDTEDIRRLRYAYGDNHNQWHAHIAPRAAVLLADELSSLDLNELHDHEGKTLMHIRDTVKNKLNEQMNPTITNDDGTTSKKESGITIVMVNLFSIEEPEEIQEKRYDLWEKELEEEIKVSRFKREADFTKAIQNMQSAAQIYIVNNIISSIQFTYDAQNGSLSEIVTLRMGAALEKAMENEELMATVPRHFTYGITDSIKQMYILLDGSGKKRAT